MEYDDLDGRIRVDREYPSMTDAGGGKSLLKWGEITYKWDGGNRIGISYELLMDCDRDIIKFRGDLPKPGDRIEVGPYSVIAVEWRGASEAPFLVCDKIDSGEE